MATISRSYGDCNQSTKLQLIAGDPRLSLLLEKKRKKTKQGKTNNPKGVATFGDWKSCDRGVYLICGHGKSVFFFFSFFFLKRIRKREYFKRVISFQSVHVLGK